MLFGVFQSKRWRMAAVLLGIAVVILLIFCYRNYSSGRRYHEQTVMAEEYLKDGNFKQATNAFLRALSLNNKDQMRLSIGLADAYLGMDMYDEALEVLRDCYKKTSNNTIKVKIEDVAAKKTDYAYQQVITRAETYYSNKEYDKAIAEFEKAKQIKSKDVTAYQRIAEAYIEEGNYDLANKSVQEGLTITQSDALKGTLDKVNDLLNIQKYETMVTEASEYIYQENYEDGIKNYEEAIHLMPNEIDAYTGLAEAYISKQEFTKAIMLLQDAIGQTRSDDLKDLLKRVTEQKAMEEESNKVLAKLYSALDQLDVDKIIAAMSKKAFKEKIATDAPVYFSPLGIGEITKGYGMIVYDSNTVYFGGITEGLKNGLGVYFVLADGKKSKDYYFYEGKWILDYPSGKGKTQEVTVKVENEEHIHYKTLTEGTFIDGKENGDMKKTFYQNDKEIQSVAYKADNGRPRPYINNNGRQVLLDGGNRYAIGFIYKDKEQTNDYYGVSPDTHWGVKAFIEK